MKELREALEKDDIEEIKKKKDALNEIAMSYATKVYEEAAKKAQAEGKDPNTMNPEDVMNNYTNDKKDEDDVIDAEFEEK